MKTILVILAIVAVAIALFTFIKMRQARKKIDKRMSNHTIDQAQADLALYRKVQTMDRQSTPYVSGKSKPYATKPEKSRSKASDNDTVISGSDYPGYYVEDTFNSSPGYGGSSSDSGYGSGSSSSSSSYDSGSSSSYDSGSSSGSSDSGSSW